MPRERGSDIVWVSQKTKKMIVKKYKAPPECPHGLAKELFGIPVICAKCARNGRRVPELGITVDW